LPTKSGAFDPRAGPPATEIAPSIWTFSVANQNTGVFAAFVLKLTVIPAGMKIEVKFQTPFGFSFIFTV
jgi:hypothetical protein